MAQKLYDMASDDPRAFDAVVQEFNDQQMLPVRMKAQSQWTMQQQQQNQPKKEEEWHLRISGRKHGVGARSKARASESFRYLALTLDRKATHSGFYRRIDYPQHGVV
jgi:hypothetical protein